MSDRMPPHSRAAEQSVLGSMLRLNACIGDVLQIVRTDQFYVDAHRTIFSAIVALYDAGKPADMVTVGEWLIAKQQFENVGAGPYLAELWDAAPSAANAEYYARIVRDKAILHNLLFAGRKIVELAESPASAADAALEEAERWVFAIAESAVAGTTYPLAHALNEASDRIDARMSSPGPAAGAVPTGFIDLDEQTAGLQNGELTILAARPSLGKTALAIGIARNAAGNSGLPVLFVSLEMSRIELAERLLSGESKVDSGRIRSGRINAEEAGRLVDAKGLLARLPIFIDDSGCQTVTRIAANARRLKLRKGIRLVVVDYLGLIDAEDRRANRQEQVASISRRLKQLARELHLPVLALAQLNRNVEYRPGEKPKLADLRDSGAVEQDADTVMLLHRPDDQPGVVEVGIAKQRNGPTGDVPLTFVKAFMRFENHAPDFHRSGTP